MKNPYPLLTAIILLALFPMATEVRAQPDVGVSAVVNPADGSTLVIGSTFPVTARVFNSGTTTLSTVQIKFNIGINNTALDEMRPGAFAPGDTIEYTFTAQFTLTDTTNSGSVYCLADTPGDVDVWNNVNPTYNYSSGIASISKITRKNEVR